MKTNLSAIYKLLPESDNSAIIAKFAEQNNYFKYYIPSPQHQELYAACYNSLKEYFLDQAAIEAAKKAAIVEAKKPVIVEAKKANDYSIQVEDSYIYKMMFLFQAEDLDTSTTLSNFDKFANTYINGLLSLEVFLSKDRFDKFDFPQNLEYASFDYDVTAMRRALPKIGYTILKNLRDLGAIQAANKGILPHEISVFNDAALRVKLPNAEKNMDLAKQCNLYDGEGKQFTEMIALMEMGTLPSEAGRLLPKVIDNLPNVKVKYVNEDTSSNYHLVKLISHDFRSMMLGNISGNCQTLANGDADPFIIDGITRANNGFYVIIKQGRKPFNPSNIDWNKLEKDGHEIVGQSYAWIGRDGKSITWEAPQLVKDRAPNIDIKEILTEFGKAVEEQGFERVTIGRDVGFRGAKNYNFDKKTYENTESHSILKEGFRYHWSINEHYEVYASTRLVEIRQQICQEIGEEYVSSITSVQQGEALLPFFHGKELNPTIKKALTSCYLTKEWNVGKLESLLSILESKTPLELETILQPQILYKYGLTIEYALKMSNEAMSLLRSLVGVGKDRGTSIFLSTITSLDELAENIASSTSELEIKKEVVKLIAKNICNEEGDFAYIDTMSENKIDFVMKSDIAMKLLYKKHYIVSRLAELDDAKFAILENYGDGVCDIINRSGQTIEGYMGKFDSMKAMKGDMLWSALSNPIFSKITWDKTMIRTLSEDKLDLLLSPEIFNMLTNSNTLHTYLSDEIHIIKKQVFGTWAKSKGLFENVEDINIPESHLDILLSSEVMDFYEYVIKYLYPPIGEYLKQLENLVTLPLAKLQLLFSQEVLVQYYSKVAPIEEMAAAIKASIEATLEWHLQSPVYKDILMHFDISTLVKCCDMTSDIVLSFLTSDYFTPTQKVKILEKLLDGDLGDKQSEVVRKLCTIEPIKDITPTRQEEITQYILDQKPFEEAVSMLYSMHYIRPIILSTIDMELLLTTWQGHSFWIPSFLSNAKEEDIAVVNHFGIDRLIKLNTKSPLANNICETTNITAQDKIAILEYVENMSDNTQAFTLLHNFSNIDPKIISSYGIENIIHLLAGTNYMIKDLNSLPDDIFNIQGMPHEVKIEWNAPQHFSKIHIAEHIILERGAVFTTELPILGFYHPSSSGSICCYEEDGKYKVCALGGADVVLDHI